MKDNISTAIRLTLPRLFNMQLIIKRCSREKELLENITERSHMIFDDGISTQSFDPMDITNSRVINNVPEPLKVF